MFWEYIRTDTAIIQMDGEVVKTEKEKETEAKKKTRRVDFIIYSTSIFW